MYMMRTKSIPVQSAEDVSRIFHVSYAAALVSVDVNRSRLAEESRRPPGRSNRERHIKAQNTHHRGPRKRWQQERDEKEKRIEGAMRGKDPRARVRNRKVQLKPRLGVQINDHPRHNKNHKKGVKKETLDLL